MSTPKIRHYLKIIVAPYNVVGYKSTKFKVSNDVAEHFKLSSVRNKNTIESFLSYIDFRNLTFIANYFYLLDYSYFMNGINLLKMEVLPDRLNSKLSRIN